MQREPIKRAWRKSPKMLKGDYQREETIKMQGVT